MLDSHHFLRNALFNQPDKNQGACWHRPVIVRDMQTRLGDVIGRLKVAQERPDDDVIDNNLVLVWAREGASSPDLTCWVAYCEELRPWKPQTPNSNRECYRLRGGFDLGLAHAPPRS